MNIPRTFWGLGERGYLLDLGWFEVLGKFDMSLLRGAGRMRKVEMCVLWMIENMTPRTMTQGSLTGGYIAKGACSSRRLKGISLQK